MIPFSGKSPKLPTNFTSVDGQMRINSETHSDLFRENYPFGDFAENYQGVFKVIFKGPAICVSRFEKLSECMPKSLKPYSICSIDLKT